MGGLWNEVCRTIAINFQPPKSIVSTIHLVDNTRNQLLGQFQLMDTIRHHLSRQLQLIDSLQNKLFNSANLLLTQIQLIDGLGNPLCWMYSHHCQIPDKNPSKWWNGEFRGFRICVGWISTTQFCVVGFYVPYLLISVLFVSILCLSWFYFTATTPRATTPHPYHHGLSRLCMHPGYHAIVYIYS